MVCEGPPSYSNESCLEASLTQSPPPPPVGAGPAASTPTQPGQGRGVKPADAR